MKLRHKKTISKYDIAKVFLRSFFVQSVWNYRTLISVGFGVCLIPIAKKLSKDKESQKAIIKRHLKFFNAHPYMTSYALGVSMQLEEAIASGEKDAHHKLDRIKELLISILGAVGDKLFWTTLKPFSLLIGISLVYLLESIEAKVLGLLAVFLMYNIPHLFLRYNGIIEGYKWGLDIYKCFKEERYKILKKVYLASGVLAFILFFIFLVTRLFEEGPAFIGVFIGSTLLASGFFQHLRNFYFTIAITFIISIIIGFVFI